jgi:hypothetical protein
MEPRANTPMDGRTRRVLEATETIAALTRLQAQLAPGELHKHIEWAKEAVWAAAYPGVDGTLLDGLAAEAENAR